MMKFSRVLLVLALLLAPIGASLAQQAGPGAHIPGPRGPAGPQGLQGVAGSKLYNAAGVPSPTLGTNGDYYVNNTTGDLSTKAAGAWAVVANIKGPQGPSGATGPIGATGATGLRGSIWLSGSGAPSSGTGLDGDFYLRTDTGQFYSRASGAWTVTASLAASAIIDTTSASNIASGTLASARLTGNYSGVTGLGTLSSLAVSGTISTGAISAPGASNLTLNVPTGSQHVFNVNGATQLALASAALYPPTTNTINLGGGSNRFATTYSVNADISGALAYGGLTFAGSATGGAGSSLVGSASPTFSGSANFATLGASGNVFLNGSSAGGGHFFFADTNTGGQTWQIGPGAGNASANQLNIYNQGTSALAFSLSKTGDVSFPGSLSYGGLTFANSVSGTSGALVASNNPTLLNANLTGTPAVPTATAGTNTTQIASTAFVQAAIASGGTGVVSYKVQKFTSSGTYTPTANTKSAVIECWGGGGGGGGTTTAATNSVNGGGGGAGGYSRKVATAATIGASQAITIGSGGSGGSTTPTNGSAGGTSSVGSLCVANGGSGGSLQQNPWLALGGAGGAAGTGDLAVIGHTGNNGGIFNSSYGGATGNGAASTIGAGGVSQTSTTANSGLAALGYASGGGGGFSYNGAGNTAGGDGTAGFVVITETIQ